MAQASRPEHNLCSSGSLTASLVRTVPAELIDRLLCRRCALNGHGRHARSVCVRYVVVFDATQAKRQGTGEEWSVALESCAVGLSLALLRRRCPCVLCHVQLCILRLPRLLQAREYFLKSCWARCQPVRMRMRAQHEHERYWRACSSGGSGSTQSWMGQLSWCQAEQVACVEPTPRQACILQFACIAVR